MPDWTKPMKQTFEFYIVDPGTWKDSTKIYNVKKCNINRDSEAETLGSATIDITESVGESYIRVYMITVQNGITEKHPLGTFLAQTPSSSFDGKIRNVSIDAYTPLLELKENQPPLGYSILKGANIMEMAYMLVRERARAPVVETKNDATLFYNFVAETSDTWMSFTTDLIGNANYEFDLDELGRILFSPKQDTASLQPVWTYSDDNSSILYPSLSMDHDLYGVPNVVEVVYSNGGHSYYATAVNDDPNSPVSTVNRGRKIVYRATDEDINNSFILQPNSKEQLEDYAQKLLRNLSTLEYRVTYKHGYCPVRVGDCVRLNYSRSGLTDIKGKVISQSIECEQGCPVTETTAFTTKLWG